MSTKKYDVFLSHSSVDNVEVRVVYDYLKEKGFSVWIDNIDLPVGGTIYKRIEDALLNSYLCIVVLSPDFIKSKWCEKECVASMNQEDDQQRTILIPIEIKDTPCLSEKLFLSSKKYINVQSNKGLIELEKELHRHLALPKHCDILASKPIVASTDINIKYHFEPSQLLPIQFEKVYSHSGINNRIPKRKNCNGITIDFIKNKWRENNFDEIVSPYILLGEAGIGKTTLCKWLCLQLAENWITEMVVPIFVPLGEYSAGEEPQVFINRYIRSGTLDDILNTSHDNKRRVVIVFDGLNEISENVQEMILNKCKSLAQNNKVGILLTSRPVAIKESLLLDSNPCFFEIQRWSEIQMNNYFGGLNAKHLLEHVEPSVLQCLKLPLMAFMLLQINGGDNAPSILKSISDMYKNFVLRFLNDVEEEKKSTVLSSQIDIKKTRKRYLIYLEILAFQMTKMQTIQADAQKLESVIGNQNEFYDCVAYAVNSGLLHCSEQTAALNAKVDVELLRTTRISFFHQTFQEYLTSQYIINNNDYNSLPVNLSQDAYWRYIPIHIVQNFFDDTQKQIEFASNFLENKSENQHPDYLMAAKVLNEINAIDSSSARQLIIKRLIENITSHNLYEYIIEVFRVLDGEGSDDLQDCLNDVSALNNVFAETEAHLLNRERTEGNESKWCRLGRSVYILGELNSIWLVEYFKDNINAVISRHLLYHIGEAYLTVARTIEIESEITMLHIANAKLAEHELADPVVKGYCQTVINQLNNSVDHNKAINDLLVSNLYVFLANNADNKRPHFCDEFWQRAHGIEVYVELASENDSEKLLLVLFEAEEFADYGDQIQKGYQLVQSSCVKGALRVLRRSKKQRVCDWSKFLTAVLKSKRANENIWLCKHLEYFLLEFGRNIEDLKWLENSLRAHSIGGENLRTVISNVLYKRSTEIDSVVK